MTWFWIFLGGGIGSLARYGVNIMSLKFYNPLFPLGTFISNVLACLILVLTVVFLSNKVNEFSWMQPLVITGFCGGFSTFSTFSNETLNLFQQGNYVIAMLNILLSLVVGIGIIYWIKTSAI